MSGPVSLETLPEPVRTLLNRVGGQLEEILQAGIDIDLAGGTSEQWGRVVSGWGVTVLGEEERFAAARAQKMTHGAPIPEVEACLQRVSAAAAQSWAQVGTSLPPDQRSQVEAVLAALPVQALALYREKACARRAGLFAHAKQDAQLHRWNVYSGQHGYVLRCAHCGAPRLGADLACAFCGGHVGG